MEIIKKVEKLSSDVFVIINATEDLSEYSVRELSKLSTKELSDMSVKVFYKADYALIVDNEKGTIIKIDGDILRALHDIMNGLEIQVWEENAKDWLDRYL